MKSNQQCSPLTSFLADCWEKGGGEYISIEKERKKKEKKETNLKLCVSFDIACPQVFNLYSPIPDG